VVLLVVGWMGQVNTRGNPIEGTGGMLRIAASCNRTDILQLLLDLGFDANERARMEDVDADGIAPPRCLRFRERASHLSAWLASIFRLRHTVVRLPFWATSASLRDAESFSTTQ
jgi:hypothetical protein